MCTVVRREGGSHKTDGPTKTRACSHTRTQKKKVSDLGELPALDWSNASMKLLVTIIVVGVILFTLYSGWMEERVQLGRFTLRQWLNGLCMGIGAYFVIELMAKVRTDPIDVGNVVAWVHSCVVVCVCES